MAKKPSPARKAGKSKARNSSPGLVTVPSSDNESLSIRSIKNGFLISRSGSRKGKYFSEDEYSPGKPVVTASVAKEAKPGSARRPSTKG